MLKDSLNKKTYIGNIEPNPKEFGIWIKEDGSAKIYDYVKNEWIGGSGSGSGNEVKWEYYKINRPAFESSSVGGEVWYDLFANCESTFRQNVDEYGRYTTSIGTSSGSGYDDYYKIALSDMPRYYDYNGEEDFIDTKSPLENFARFIINMYFSTDMEFMLEELNSFLIPITKEEYITIDHLAEYKSE